MHESRRWACRDVNMTERSMFLKQYRKCNAATQDTSVNYVLYTSLTTETITGATVTAVAAVAEVVAAVAIAASAAMDGSGVDEIR